MGILGEPVLPEQPDVAIAATEAVETLEHRHNYLLHCVREAWQKPSANGLANVQAAAEAAIGSVDPFYQNNFYGESGNELATEASIKSFLRFVAELVDQTNKIQPAKVRLNTTPDLEKGAIRILNDCGNFDNEEVDDLSQNRADAQTEELCEAYCEGIQICVNTLCESPNVSKFLRRYERLEKIKNNAALIGKIADGTALGYGLVRVGEYLVDKF
jgi:hypothetical protein